MRRTTRPDVTEPKTLRVCARPECGRPVFRAFFLCWVHQCEIEQARRAAAMLAWRAAIRGR